MAAGGGLCGGQRDYETLVLAQLRELWTEYGSLAELWFDGSTPDAKHFLGLLSEEIVELQQSGELEGELGLADFEQALARTQPSVSSDDLVAFAAWQDEFGSK